MGATAYIALGSNLGDSAAIVREAIRELGELPSTRLVRSSSLYRTDALADTPQPEYINAVAEIASQLAPSTLLAALLEIESRHGRRRTVPNAARSLDLDLLLYGCEVIDLPGLKVPHPRMHQRAFVLAPLVEIAPECRIPGRGPARAALAEIHGQHCSPIAP
jgi:2-amino-4-hydroxy-6-hydroxymethyldihydropteridine diphosphokinase